MDAIGLDFDTRQIMTGISKENLIVKFYFDEIESQFRFEPDGSGVKTRKEMVSIQIPGTTEVMRAPVNDDHRKRFAREYAAWQEGQRGHQEFDGISIDKWTRLKPEKRDQLKALGFYTINQIAAAADSSINRIGYDGFSLRKEANLELARNRNAVLDESRNEADEKIAQLQAMVLELAAKLEAKESGEVKEAKPKKEKAKPTE